VQHLLQVQRAEEEHAEHAGHRQHLHQVCDAQLAGAEHAQRHQRVARGRLADHERGQQQHRDGAEQQRPAGRPAEFGGRLHDGVDAEHQRRGDQHCAEHVDAAARVARRLLVGVQQPDGDERGGDADRHVHEEDPVPAQHLREDATGQQPDGAATGRDERVHADRLGLLARLGEQRDDHAQDDGRGERAADALCEAGGDQYQLVLRDAAAERRDREQAEPGEEHAAPADQVADPAGEQQQAAERDQVGVHHPGQAGVGEAQVMLDGRQRDVHDRGVEHDHEHARTERVEREPARAVGGGCGCHGEAPVPGSPWLGAAGPLGLSSVGRDARAEIDIR
jgi:hypothetical protein